MRNERKILSEANMATRRRRSKKNATTLTTRSDVRSIHAVYLTLKGEKLAQRLKDLTGRPGKATTAIAKETSLVGAFLEGFEKGKICGQIEQSLDGAIKFLQDNANDPSMQEQCDNVRKGAVSLLNDYANNC